MCFLQKLRYPKRVLSPLYDPADRSKPMDSWEVGVWPGEFYGLWFLEKPTYNG